MSYRRGIVIYVLPGYPSKVCHLPIRHPSPQISLDLVTVKALEIIKQVLNHTIRYLACRYFPVWLNYFTRAFATMGITVSQVLVVLMITYLRKAIFSCRRSLPIQLDPDLKIDRSGVCSAAAVQYMHAGSDQRTQRGSAVVLPAPSTIVH